MSLDWMIRNLVPIKNTLPSPLGPQRQHGVKEVKSDLQSVVWITEAYDRLLKRKFGDDSYGAQIALREAIANYAKHANKLDPQKLVTIEGWQYDDAVIFKISSPSGGFDLGAIEWNPNDTNPTKTNGRGNAYMLHYADYLAYEPSGKALYLGFKLRQKDNEEKQENAAVSDQFSHAS